MPMLSLADTENETPECSSTTRGHRNYFGGISQNQNGRSKLLHCEFGTIFPNLKYHECKHHRILKNVTHTSHACQPNVGRLTLK